MKKLLTIILLVIAFVVNAATINVVNPGTNNDIQPNIVTAISAAATRGDTIAIPAGTFKFNSNINVNTGKTFVLKGAGVNNAGNTILFRDNATSEATLEGWEYMFRFNPLSDKPCGIVIHGITFRSQTPSETNGGDGLSMALDYGIIMFRAVDFVIYDCTFENFGNSGIEVNHRDDIARGLIYDCIFTHNAKGATGQGYGYGVSIYGENTKWIVNPRFGTNDFIFIEDCVFSQHRHGIASGGCSKYVARYNDFDRMEYGENYETQAIDLHDGNGPDATGVNKFASRAAEIYNNTITLSTYITGTTYNGTKHSDSVPETGIKIRGGEALIHHNTINGTRFGIGLDPIASNATPYPWWCQIGYISGKVHNSDHSGTSKTKSEGDVFYWSNTFTNLVSSNSASTFILYTYQGAGGAAPNPATNQPLVKQDRDYHASDPGYSTYTYPHPMRQ